MAAATAFLRILDPDGGLVADLPEFARSSEAVVALYRAMVLTRTFDEKAVALQRTGRLGTYASSLGQEAVGVGIASAMQARDILVPSFREHGAQLLRGVSVRELLLFWGGDERGSNFAGPVHDFPVSIPVASQFPHAAGVALALVMRGEDAAVVAIGGDGSTSKGDFYETLNVAGVWRLPLVVVIANNQWAISMPRDEQSAAETLAQKAVAAGIRGEQVDGNDVLAMRASVEQALARARSGEGATLIEALTYRLSDHTTADDASRYRDESEVVPHWKEEPISRLRSYLVQAAGWSKADEERIIRETRDEIEQGVQAYLETPPDEAEAIFAHLYETLPPALDEQLTAFRQVIADG